MIKTRKISEYHVEKKVRIIRYFSQCFSSYFLQTGKEIVLTKTRKLSSKRVQDSDITVRKR